VGKGVAHHVEGIPVRFRLPPAGIVGADVIGIHRKSAQRGHPFVVGTRGGVERIGDHRSDLAQAPGAEWIVLVFGQDRRRPGGVHLDARRRRIIQRYGQLLLRNVGGVLQRVHRRGRPAQQDPDVVEFLRYRDQLGTCQLTQLVGPTLGKPVRSVRMDGGGRLLGFLRRGEHVVGGGLPGGWISAS
jgi:hypothetical protein